MTLQEIQNYISVGKGYIEIARDYLSEYQGICRRVYIRKNKIQIDYISADWLDIEEGEETFYFCYNNLEDTIKATEKYLVKPLSEWTNYNKTYNLWNFTELSANSWTNFFKDLQKRKLDFPKDFLIFRIRTLYARAIFMNMASPDEDAFDLFKNPDFLDEIQEKDSNFKSY